MKPVALIAALVIATTLGGPTAFADFQAGLKAYRAGDHATAARIWQQDAEAGEPAAQRNLGLLYLNGQGVARNPQQAAFWFTRSADQGFAPAAANLADMYLRGRGVPGDRRKAAEYMRIAAEGGLPESQHNMGIFYEHGVGVAKDEDTAVFWYRRAAAQNFAKSADRLAVLRPNAAAESEPDKVSDEATDKTRTARAPTGNGLVDNLAALFSPAD